MTETEGRDESKREMFTKLLPHLAISAIGMGLFSSPVSLLLSAADRYNQATEATAKKVNDLVPLLPWLQRLQLRVDGPRTASLTMRKEDMGSSLEQYLVRRFLNEGASGAKFGEPPGARERAEFEYALRLPMRNVYARFAGTLTESEKGRYLEMARRLNPSEVWLLVDGGEEVDEPMDSVFVSENVVLRGRLKSVTRTEMLSELFGKEFEVRVEPQDDGSVRVMLRLKA
ncbi:MAG: hypothetical protein JRN06_02265 [Nitrososphaerota archaeon]|nr:hypothetical protein [Nitrososphaerota archaeon]MDG7023320.1 hypothetical protein [Nitrososphaerota archaeon]